MSTEEENKLISHQVSSKAYYDSGDFARAEDQCRRGLAIDEDHENLRLTLGFALLRQGTPRKLQEAIEVFDGMDGLFGGGDDWRVDMGLGIACQQLAHLQGMAPADSKEAAKPEAIAKLRDRSRAALERAAEGSAAKGNTTGAKDNTPADIPYHLALLDLDEQAGAPFFAHAGLALAKLEEQDKVFGAQLSQPMGESERNRTAKERELNARRGQLLCREMAIRSFDQQDNAAAAAAMERLEKFGELDRGDYFSRARIREQLGKDEEAVRDYEKFIGLSTTQLDDAVGKAVTALTRLRSRLAEKRTATPPGGP
jgi:tetratricopeptide (TPR) repeat protein